MTFPTISKQQVWVFFSLGGGGGGGLGPNATSNQTHPDKENRMRIIAKQRKRLKAITISNFHLWNYAHF